MIQYNVPTAFLRGSAATELQRQVSSREDARQLARSTADRVLERVAGRRGHLSDAELADAAEDLARALLMLAHADQRAVDERQARRLARIIRDPRGQTFTRLLTDRAARVGAPSAVLEQARWLTRCLGVPRFLAWPERAALRLATQVGPLAPSLVGRQIRRVIHDQARAYVSLAERGELARELDRLHGEGLRVNLNPIGEDVVDEGEAERRVTQYVELLRGTTADAVSVKVSSILAITDPAAFEPTSARLRERLGRICRGAMDAAPSPYGDKVVMLDMEAYRDFELTLRALEAVLTDPELDRARVGIALQAYLPDSHGALERLLQLGEQRVARGGWPLRLRIVKGANLSMERVESRLHGYELPTYGSKREVDASYKQMVDRACDPTFSGATSVGIASHNPFELAWGLVCRAAAEREGDVGFELLSGMNDPLTRAVQEVGGDVLVYLPIVEERQLASAVAYLTRRLDEVTGPDNYLRRSPELVPSEAAWREQASRARRAAFERHEVCVTPRRPANRFAEAAPLEPALPFRNEPETDFSSAGAREHLESVLRSFRERGAAASQCALLCDGTLPLVIAGEPRFTDTTAPGRDPSRPGVTPYRVSLAGARDIEDAIATASRVRSSWESRVDRPLLLRAVAQRLRERRADLIAAMVLDGGKRRLEADIEVSEAIDYAEYYARSYEGLLRRADLALEPRGPILVAPPWNFPLAIPLGGALAALVAGNPVVLKPAPETPLVGALAASACWDAGIPSEVLQLVFADDEAASQLVTDPRVMAVVLTGATDTARLLLGLRPGLQLFAETGGKNPFIVTELCDRELAVRDVLVSAFGHAGQKCSAASVLILSGALHDDASFLNLLRDAASSLIVGSAWEPDSFVTPLIRLPTGPLKRALERLEPGEEWLLEPRVAPSNDQLYSPGIKIGVTPGGFTHQTELFGPVLAVVRAEDLEDAVRIANGTRYGLTAGLHSLDEREQAYFSRHVLVGNRYVNRTTTGAIVGRQSFGGWKASSFGPGAKAGGPNYVLELCLASDAAAPSSAIVQRAAHRAQLRPNVRSYLAEVRGLLAAAELQLLERAAERYASTWVERYCTPEDSGSIPGQSNLFAYVPAEPLLLRVGVRARPVDVARAFVAMLTASAIPEISVDPAAESVLPLLLPVASRALRVESEAALADRAHSFRFGRVRLIGAMSESLSERLSGESIHVAREPVTSNGLLELRPALREVSLSVEHHRFGMAGRAVPEGSSSESRIL